MLPWNGVGRTAVACLLAVTLLLQPVASAPSEEPPLVDAGLDQQVPQGSTVLLDATGSRDPDGGELSYEWEIRAPSGAIATPECSECGRTSFQAAETGRYTVTVTVTDDEGRYRSDTLYVRVGDDQESATGGPAESSADSGSNQAGGSATDTAPRYVVASGGALLSASPDQRGVWVRGDDTARFEIDGPAEADVGDQVTFHVADLDGLDEPSISWSIDGRSGSGESTTGSFAEPGTYFVSAAASDGETTLRDTATIEITGNDPPVIDIYVDGRVEPGNTVQVKVGKKRDPDGYITDTQWSGSPMVSIPREGGSSTTVSVTVEDDDGATATDSVTISTDDDSSNNDPSTSYTCYGHGSASADDTSADQEFSSKTTEIEYCVDSEGSRVNDPSKQWINDNIDDNETSVTLKNMQGKVIKTYGETAAVADTLNTITKSASKDGLGTYTLGGKTVYSDLNGDGEINALDWDVNFRDQSDETQTNHQEQQDLQGHADTRQKAQQAANSDLPDTVPENAVDVYDWTGTAGSTPGAGAGLMASS